MLYFKFILAIIHNLIKQFSTKTNILCYILLAIQRNYATLLVSHFQTLSVCRGVYPVAMTLFLQPELGVTREWLALPRLPFGYM